MATTGHSPATEQGRDIGVDYARRAVLRMAPEGERDRMIGHLFRPTHRDRCEDGADRGYRYGLSRDEFKWIYREAYLRGYRSY
jgi:hypothetical protein